MKPAPELALDATVVPAPASMTTTDWLLVAAIAALVGFAALLALAETSLTRMSRAKAMGLVEEKKRGASTLLALVQTPERFLNPVLLLVLLCQLIAATLVGVVAEHLFGPIGVAVATAFEVVVIFVVGEAAPKNWAVRHPERAALLSAPMINALVRFPPVRLLSAILIGISNLILPGKVTTGPFVSERELLALADVAAEEDVIEVEERALIRSILDFGDTVVREVMVPRTDMVTLESRAQVADALEVAMAAGFSRMPVYGQNVDDVVGIVYTKDLMRADLAGQSHASVAEFARKAEFVPETKRVAELMREMQQKKYHMAIVVDEYGGTSGLVTLEDLIEELVGEIVDEFDVEEPRAERLANGHIRVNARMPLDEVNELLGAELPSGDWDTIGGLVYQVLGHVPSEGEGALVDEYRLVAEKVQGRRIGRVRIIATAADAQNQTVEEIQPAQAAAADTTLSSGDAMSAVASPSHGEDGGRPIVNNDEEAGPGGQGEGHRHLGPTLSGGGAAASAASSPFGESLGARPSGQLWAGEAW